MDQLLASFLSDTKKHGSFLLVIANFIVLTDIFAIHFHNLTMNNYSIFNYLQVIVLSTPFKDIALSLFILLLYIFLIFPICEICIEKMICGEIMKIKEPKSDDNLKLDYHIYKLSLSLLILFIADAFLFGNKSLFLILLNSGIANSISFILFLLFLVFLIFKYPLIHLFIKKKFLKHDSEVIHND